MAKKKFALRPDQIKPLATNRGCCVATDMIVVEGRKVGYFYRDEPQDQQDSGWVFTAGRESPDYMDDARNHGVYNVNSLANYDPEIIPFLDAPTGCSFEREGGIGRFVQVHGERYEPHYESGPSSASPAQKGPPPGVPLVEGSYLVTDNWSIQLPERFARSMEGKTMVLWRPGFTVRITVWNNDPGNSRAERLAALKRAVSKKRYAEQEAESPYLTRYSYRLRDESDDHTRSKCYQVVLSEASHLHLAFYFDEVAEVQLARTLVESVTI